MIFTDVEVNRYEYGVEEVLTLEGTAVEEMEAGDWDLTLFTCTIGGRLRVTVRCSRTEGENEADSGEDYTGSRPSSLSINARTSS